jgi:hypothetical protein
VISLNLKNKTMTPKEFERRIERWCDAEGIRDKLLAMRAAWIGYKIAEEEMGDKDLLQMVKEIHARVVPPPYVSYREEDNEEPEEE